MARAPDRSCPQPLSCRICLACVLLIQLAWILPFTFFLLVRSSTPRLLILDDRNISRRTNTLGFSGAVKVLHDHELSVLKRIYEDWSRLWPVLKGNLSSKGFVQLGERTCFLWLPECYTLAKHPRILQIVKEVIGPKVLLYGVTVWKGKNEALQRFHRNAEAGECEKLVDYVYGANVQFVSRSHKILERLLQIVLRNLVLIEEESFTFPTKQAQFEYVERTFVERVKKAVRISDLWLENLELKDGYGVFLHGGTLHRIGEPLEDRVGLLLQFISADCKVRHAQNYGWGSQATSHSLYMPPVLLVAGDQMELDAVNDIRLTLVKEEGLLLKIGNEKKLAENFVGSERKLNRGNDDPFHVGNVTVFSEANASIAWQDGDTWRFRQVGEASTTVMAHCRVKRFSLGNSFYTTKFGMVAGDGEQVIVVLTEGMLYFRAIMDGDLAHYEVLELRAGSAVLLSKKILHALVPLDPEAGFMSLYWVGHGNETINGNDTKASVENQLLTKEILGNGFTKATEGRTITLASGQAYDPDNNEYCDVIIFVVEGYLLQVLPSNVLLQAFDVLLIPAHQPCVLWNTGGLPIKFFAMHLCRFENYTQAIMSFGASGKVF